MSIRIFICHRDQLVREGYSLILKQFDDIDVVGEADAVSSLVDRVESTRPHVVLLAGVADDECELTAVARSRDRVPDVRVLLVSRSEEPEGIYRAARAGASGFLLPNLGSAELVQAVRTVAAGGVYLAPATARHVLDDLLAKTSGTVDEGDNLLTDLTNQEVSVLRSLSRGLSNAEIGRELFLSESTVKTHMSHLFRKLGVRDRVQAVIKAYEAGLAAAPAADEAPAPILKDRHRLRVVVR